MVFHAVPIDAVNDLRIKRRVEFWLRFRVAVCWKRPTTTFLVSEILPLTSFVFPNELTRQLREKIYLEGVRKYKNFLSSSIQPPYICYFYFNKSLLQ